MMTTRLAPNSKLANKENATSRLIKGKVGIIKEQTTHNGAFGDIANTLKEEHDLKNVGKKAFPVKKKDDLPKIDLSVQNKENKPDIALKSKVTRKLVRQESIPVLKTSQAIVKENAKTAKSSKVSKDTTSTIIEQTKDLVIYDPDENCREDPQMVTEYIQDILAYVKGIENAFPIEEKFLDNLKITPKMRATLVNWLVEAHMNFNMELDTLHLCIAIVDRYLQVNKSVDRSTFQLVGTCALMIASKYEEIYIPNVDEFVYICDNAFKKSQLLQMECDIVKKLDFRLAWPLSIFFLRRYSKVALAKSDQHTLAKYLLELALLEYSLAHVKPSLQAAAACCLSIAVMTEIMDPLRVWTPTLVHYTKYKYSDFKGLVGEFAHLLVQAETSKFDNVRLKYSKAKYGKISTNCKLQGPLIRKLTSPAPNKFL